ncbi:MAG: cardiolipin synthase [Peptostreptococcaceae bacterium]
MLSTLKEIWYEFSITAIYIINFTVIVSLIFKQKRSIETTIAWILVLSIIPVIGFFIYMAFGRGISKDNMFKIKEAEDKILKENIIDTHKKLNQQSKVSSDLYEYKDMIYTLANSNNAILTTNNDLCLYSDSTEFFDSLLLELKNAKKYINIQFYIFKDDNIGNEIIDILIDKAQNGVEVRFLYDAVGSRSIKNRTISKLRDAGVKTSAFFPSFMKIFNFNVNYRNHRKIVTIDDEIGFIGGNNVGDEYLSKNKRFGYWRDTHLLLKGDSVLDLNMRFLLDWRYTTDEVINLDSYLTKTSKKTYSSETPIQIVSSGPESTELDEIKFGYMKMVQKAKKYIYIQSPYFILDKSLTETLKLACLSGVDVKIMFPGKPDHPFVYWASSSYAGELLKFGAKIYNYNENSFLHAKTMVIDDKVCSIGTANMDIRSFELNFEINAFIYESETSINQRLAFENDLLESKEITLEMYNSRTRSVRIKESISRLLSPIL